MLLLKTGDSIIEVTTYAGLTVLDSCEPAGAGLI